MATNSGPNNTDADASTASSSGDYSEASDLEQSEVEQSNVEQPDVAPDSGGPDAAETGDEAPTLESLQAALTLAEEAAAKSKDQALRALADSENVKRRAVKDVESAHKFALDKFVADLLPVIDSLEKAVESVAQVAGDSDTEAANAFSEGVQLSLKLALDTLKKHGVEQINPLGEPFDPQHHEAMAMVPNPDAEPNSVMDVMQPGYLLNGRLVRAAMVVVAKSPE